RVVTQIRGDFEAYVSVATFYFLINRTQKIRSILNVTNGKNFVTCLGVEIGSGLQRFQQICVIVAARDCFLEDRGIRRNAPQAIFIDQTLQFAAGDQVAPDVIQPNRLAELLKIFYWIRGLGGFQNSGGLHKNTSLSTNYL